MAMVEATRARLGRHHNALIQQFVRRTMALAVISLTAIPAVYADDSPVQEVVVTGSRIRQSTGMTTPVPVTTMSTSDLAALKPNASIGDQLDKLPQLFQTESAQRSSGALFGNAGGTYLNLRGLESKRTLVLLDGSRVVEDDRGGTVNVGVFPTALIKNVDIITGGASAQYGADAVGGVVNFVLDRNYEGFKINASTGKTEFGDGFSNKFGIAGGVKLFDKLHIVGSLDYNHIDQIMRDPAQLGSWFARWGFVSNPAYKSATLTPNVPQRITLPNVVSSVHSPFGRIDTAYSALSPSTGLGTTVTPFMYNNYVFNQDGKGVRPFVPGPITSGAGGTQSMSGGPEVAADSEAFPGGPYGAEVTEPSAFLGLKYDVTDRFRLITQAMYGQSQSDQLNQRGLPHMQDIWFATIYADNAFLPAQVAQAMQQQGVKAFKFLKLGQLPGLQNWADNQTDHNVHTMFTWSVGAEADLWSDWQAKFNWQTGRSHKFTEVLGDLRVDREFLALDSVIGPSGTPICRVQLYNPTPAQLAGAPSIQGALNKFGQQIASPVGLDNTISGCVPLNAFGQGNVSQAARDYLTQTKWGISDVHQHFGEALLTGKLVDGWAGPISSAFGVTYRKEALVQTPYPTDVELLGPPLNDPALGIQGIPGGFTGGSPNLIQFSTVPPISGEYNVKEVFGEVQIPLFKTSTGQRLDSDIAVRESRYSIAGSVEAHKIGLDFTVYSDLRLRGTLSRDVREATFAERFDSQGSGGSVNDPAPVGLNGVANQSFQITSVAVGNPNLNPEKADTITFGAIYRPSFEFLDGLQLSADYYSIKVKDAIGQLGVQNIVTYCFQGQTALCQYVQRDPASGTLTRVFNPYLNIAQVKVRGIDFEAQYVAHPNLLPNAPQTLAFRAFGSRLLERTNIPTPGAPEVHLDGGFDVSGANGPVLYPRWKANGSVAYTYGSWTAQVLEEWIDASKINVAWVQGIDVDDNWLPNYFNTDFKLAYDREIFGGHPMELALFVTNVMNRDPIIIPNYNSRTGSQSVSNNYDAYGRSYALSFNFKF
ncbi:MAG TPA: TonB-dependent receptor [Steroidobacteraceae bacterium]|jgi:outer membrane receptor protein involved in Fe transport